MQNESPSNALIEGKGFGGTPQQYEVRVPITVAGNIASLQAQRRLAEGTASLGGIYERLASGQRINRQGDDAAGFAVGALLHLNSRAYTQSIRNLNLANGAVLLIVRTYRPGGTTRAG